MSSCNWIAIPSTIRFSDFFLFYVRLWFAFCAAFFIIIVSSLSRSIFLFFFFFEYCWYDIFYLFVIWNFVWSQYIFLLVILFFFWQGVTVAPLWDSGKCQFVGVLSALDFILILQEVSISCAAYITFLCLITHLCIMVNSSNRNGFFYGIRGITFASMLLCR